MFQAKLLESVDFYAYFTGPWGLRHDDAETTGKYRLFSTLNIENS